jgi:hypothetical protein
MAILSHAADSNANFVLTVSYHDDDPPPPPTVVAPQFSSHHDAIGTPIQLVVVHPHDTAQTAAPVGDQQSRQASTPTLSAATDSLTLAPQAASDIDKHTVPAGATLSLVQQSGTPPGLPGEASLNRSLSGTLLIPQAAGDVAGSTATDLPRSSPDQDGAAANVTDKESGLVQSDEGSAVASFDDSAEGKFDPAALPADRAALLANLQLNIEAVDQALDAMVSEIERLGGEIATWFDDWTLSNWGTAAAIVVACGLGGRYWWLERVRRSQPRDTEEESSSWLFTRLQNPAGQP